MNGDNVDPAEDERRQGNGISQPESLSGNPVHTGRRSLTRKEIRARKTEKGKTDEDVDNSKQGTQKDSAVRKACSPDGQGSSASGVRPRKVQESAKRSGRRVETRIPAKTAEVKGQRQEKASPGNFSEVKSLGSGGSARQEYVRGAKAAASCVITIVLVLVAVFIVVSARFVPLPNKSYVVAPAVIPARNTAKVCPAPPKLLDAAIGVDPQFSPVSQNVRTQIRAFTTSGGPDGSPGTTITDLEGRKLVQDEDGTEEMPHEEKSYIVAQTGRRVEDTVQATAGPVGGRQTEIASMSSYSADDGDMQGLSVANCQTPRNELWISGISTSLGYTSILTVANLGQGTAAVNITLYDEQGVSDSAAAATQLVVQPQSERSVMLAALARSKERLTIKVSSTASAVTATVAQNKMRGLSSGGVEILTPGEGPAMQQVIPAYRQENPQDIEELSSQFGYQDAVPSLQVTAPDGDAKVRVRAYNRQGEQELPEREFDVRAQTVRDISLTDLPEGLYALEVTSDNNNILAAARMVSGKRGDSMDFAWAQGTKTVVSDHIFAVSALGDTIISLFSPRGRGKVQLTAVTADGLAEDERNFDVPEGRVVDLSLEDYGDDVVGFMVGAVDGLVFAAQVVSVESKRQISWASIPRPGEEQSGVPVVLQY